MVDKKVIAQIRKNFKTWAPGWRCAIRDISTDKEPVIVVKLSIFNKELNIRDAVMYVYTGRAVNLLAAGRVDWFDNEHTNQWINLITHFDWRKAKHNETCTKKKLETKEI